ncbi:MAG: type II toxin-antitoxin system VapC family toxin [Bacteroidaceae bacterium]|nr:type II toxin-antitoxin system VapC family toxin [Bacteroidaceae bacterium]
MRYLIDTNIFIYLSTDREKLSLDVVELLNEPDTLAYISVESIRELIIAYNNKGWGNKKWKSAEDLVNSIEETFFIEILPIQKDVMQTYSRLSINRTMNHKDPSDHVIISHAITLGMPLISSDTRFPYYTRQGLKLIFNER